MHKCTSSWCDVGIFSLEEPETLLLNSSSQVYTPFDQLCGVEGLS